MASLLKFWYFNKKPFDFYLKIISCVCDKSKKPSDIFPIAFQAFSEHPVYPEIHLDGEWESFQMLKI